MQNTLSMHCLTDPVQLVFPDRQATSARINQTERVIAMAAVKQYLDKGGQGQALRDAPQ